MKLWDDLSMREKAEMMRVAVSNGITTLPEIKQAYNEFAEGGAMPETQPAENDGWSMEDEAKYREWRSKLPFNLRNTNDNDYDMREAYKAGMQPTLENDGFYHLGSRNPKTGRILKAPHHPTYLKAINTDARMGYYPRTEKGITYTDTWRGNLFGDGGYKPSERIKQRIAHYEGKAITGATDPLSGKWAKNNSFESEAKNFYNALPRDIREQVLSNPELADSLYSFSYNVGAGRFKERVVPALRNYYNGKGTVQDIENSMWASGDSKLRGLQRRRAEERKGVRNALIGDVPYLPSDTPSYPTIYDMPQYIPAQPQAFSAPLTSYQPVMLPDEQQPIVREAMAYDPKEIERQERQRGLNNFMTLMSMASPQENGNPYLDTIGMLAGNQFKKGGKIYIKPNNRGKFTKLKERTGHSATWFKEHGTPAQKKMAIFELNARHWKHGLGGNLFDGTSQPSQQMDRPNIFRYDDGRYVYQAAPDAEEIEVSPINTLLPNPSQWTYQDASGKIYTPHATQVDTGSIIQDEERNPLVRAANNYMREAAYRAKDGTLALQGKYTMPAIAASALLPVAGEAAYPILTNPYVDAGIASASAGHGLNHTINEGIDGLGDAAMTALELVPLGRLAKPVYEGVVQPGMKLFNSPLTGNWTKIGNREYRLSPNSLGANGSPLESRAVAPQITAENAANMTPEQLDVAYKAAVESGNRPEALRLLEQAYLRSGIPRTDITVTPEGHAVGWYHGSEWGNHTIFDSSAMNATIGGASAHGKVKGNFLTTDVPSAMRYAGSSRYSSANVPEYTSPQTFSEKVKNLFGIYKPRRLYPAERVGDYAPKPERLFDTKGKPALDHIDKVDNVVYPLYVNPGKDVMRLDFQGKPWSQSPVDFPNNFYLKRHIRDDVAKTYRDEIVPYKDYETAYKAWIEDPINIRHGSTSLDGMYFDDGIRSIEGFNSAPRYETVRLMEERVPNTTNGAVQTAAKEGKTSVLMRNVIDSNGGPEGIHYAIDDFVTLKPNQQKLADITYDDNGNLIPLSQRFNWYNSDIRYGLLPFLGLGTAGTLYGKQE